MIKNYSGTIVKIDKDGKERILVRTNNKELAKEATKSLNLAEKIKSTVKPPKKEEVSNTFLMDKYKSKYI